MSSDVSLSMNDACSAQLGKLVGAITGPRVVEAATSNPKELKTGGGWPNAEDFLMSKKASLLAELIMACLHPHPPTRPAMTEVANHLETIISGPQE